MKLLITGGCGFLGSNLAIHALERGDELVIFDNLYREGSVNNLKWLQVKGKFIFKHGDIRNQDDVSCIVKAFIPDVIFHLAGQVAMTTSITNPRMDFEVNAMGTVNLLEAVRLYAKDARIIYSSTNKVYGDLEQFSYYESETRYDCIDKPHGFDEATPLDFHSPYGCSKGAADQYILDYGRIFGLNTMVFRHSSMYGARQFATYDQGWIGWFCKKAFETKKGVLKEPFTISGNGKQVRDVLHVGDMVKLYFSAAQNVQQFRNQPFNIGGGFENSLSLLELFSLLEDSLAIKLNYFKIKPRESDQLVFVADITKARNNLDWSPNISYKKGIGQMLEWIANTQ